MNEYIWGGKKDDTKLTPKLCGDTVTDVAIARTK